MKRIFSELNEMYVRTQGIDNYIEILKTGLHLSKNIVGIGAGRMGYSLRAHIMRLTHIGYNAYFIGDTSTPRIDSDSIVVINSSSGETPTNLLYANQARSAGSCIVTFTSDSKSSIAKISDFVVQFPSIESHQLMKSVYEQYTLLLFDFISESLVAQLSLDRNIITHNHSILE